MTNRELKQVGKFLKDLVIVMIVLVVFFWMAIGCSPPKNLIVPTEPTIWIVSEVFEDPKHPFPNGLVGYKMIPVNPGSINARPTWKLDFKGKYSVGQRLDFAPIVADTREK